LVSIGPKKQTEPNPFLSKSELVVPQPRKVMYNEPMNNFSACPGIVEKKKYSQFYDD